MKRIVILILIILLSLSFAASAEDYMKYYWQYTAAAESGDPSAICKAVDNLYKALPNPKNADEYGKLLWPAYMASYEYERAQDYDKATYYYQKFIEYAEWLEQNAGQDHRENIKFINAVLESLTLTPELYIATSKPADSVYYGQKHEPRYGTFYGKCDELEGSETGHLLYIQFFEESIIQHDYRVPDEPCYLLVAWNLPSQSKVDFDRVNSGQWDEYIIENVKYLATLEHKVLLRFGAEVNCWAIPEDETERQEFINGYISAFRRVATFARQYAPDVAMVYSPNDISNFYVTEKDFYPGDEYVDWVGMSSYYVLGGESGEPADKVDAYYRRGLYANPMAKIADVIKSFGDKKPILISECGFAYSEAEGQNPTFAKQRLRLMYSYVNMLYPQVKGILFFDTDFEKKFALDGCPELKGTFKECVEENVGIQAMVEGSDRGYTRFSTFEGKAQELELYTYAYFPSKDEVNISYSIDSQAVPCESLPPYRATVDATKLSAGKHTICVNITSGAYSKVLEYPFYITEDRYIVQNAESLSAPFSDVTADKWYYSDVNTAYRRGLINGKAIGIYLPDDNMTYAEAIKLASCVRQLYHEGKVTLTNGVINWYDSYYSYAEKYGMIKGTESANEPIDRKEFVRIFHSAFPSEEYVKINNVEHIPDITKLSSEYKDLIFDFYNAGILTGSEGGYFKPDDNIKRSEVAAILTRMFDRESRKKI